MTDGHWQDSTGDRRLDRLQEFDHRSRDYPIRGMYPERAVLRGYSWRPKQTLDQGNEGACVGFGWTHELISRPRIYQGLDDSFAQLVYLEAQTIDQWPGENYSGTSVLAGAKVIQRRGFMREFRWAFGLEDVLRTLAFLGPVVLGVDWWSDMYATDVRGFISPTGIKRGGHCIEAYGISVRGRYVKLMNSWGTSWGNNGTALISWDHLEQLLHDGGEACVPVGRLREPVTR